MSKKCFNLKKKIRNKSAPNGTKNVPKQTKNIVVFCGTLLYGFDLCGLVWFCITWLMGPCTYDVMLSYVASLALLFVIL